ncbi:MAG: major capsid protein [Treponema sp.]|nr:major capsid protein [Treponema sp.]
MPEFLKKVLRMFTDGRRNVERGFFSFFFKTTEEDYTNAEYVELDVERTTNTVAPTLRDSRTGAVIVKSDSWKEHKFRPPYIGLKEPIDLMSLLERMPGESDDAERVGSWFGRLAAKIVRALSKFHRMIGLQVDLQAAQIMQTGRVTLKDDKDNTSFDLDFGAAVTHFPTAAVGWGNANATPVEDVAALADVVAADGQTEPALLILGDDAWKNLLKDDIFKEFVKKDGLGLGTLQPGLRTRGGVYHGMADFGSHTLEIWTFSGTYKTLANSTPQRFLDKDAAIVTARPEDLDFRTVYGGIPSLGMKEPFTQVVPSVVTFGNSGEGTGFIRVNNRVFEDESQDTYTAEAKCRPLSIPVSIDRYGCLKTQVV